MESGVDRKMDSNREMRKQKRHICFALVVGRGASPLRRLTGPNSGNGIRIFAYGFGLALSKGLMRRRMIKAGDGGGLVVLGASIGQVGGLRRRRLPERSDSYTTKSSHRHCYA